MIGQCTGLSGLCVTGQARPTVLVWEDRFDTMVSVMVCVFRFDATDAPLFRITVGSSQ